MGRTQKKKDLKPKDHEVRSLSSIMKIMRACSIPFLTKPFLNALLGNFSPRWFRLLSGHGIAGHEPEQDGLGQHRARTFRLAS